MKTVKHKDITVAVLPFKILTEESSLSTLMFGFTEDLIMNFSKFLGLSVVSHLSTQHIKDASDREAIKKLGVDYLVTGSFRPLGEKVRISIQLVRTKNKSVVFAGQHIESPESILGLEDTVTQQIVNVLQQQIDYNLLSHSYKKENTKLAAYTNYLKGMEVLRKGTLESDLKARNFFNEALKIDPNYAHAYTGISMTYFNEWSCQLWERWDVSSKGARKYAMKALEIDENDYRALMVMGRIYLYTEEYEKAEHLLRKSVRMNPNDAKNLMRVANSMVYLGLADESEKLYKKANMLNPIQQDHYFTYGSFIYFELGQFEKAIEIAKKVKLESTWVDFPVFMAASYFHLSNFEKSKEYWDMFLHKFKNHIHGGKEPSEKDALEWQISVNPYKSKTNLRSFWEYIAKNKNVKLTAKKKGAVSFQQASFILKDELWELNFQGQKVFLKDAKGYSDILKLLTEPNKEFHCMELMGANFNNNTEIKTIDQKAKESYQKRIRELQHEIKDAEEMHNNIRLGSLQEEYEILIDHLSQSLGLAGKPRTMGSSVEKARSAVTWRIRSAIKKLAIAHPSLGNHLSKSIKTGTFCSYKPELQLHWVL